MAGECVVCKTDFGFEEWSLNEMFLDWGNKVNEARLGLYDDILDDREGTGVYIYVIWTSVWNTLPSYQGWQQISVVMDSSRISILPLDPQYLLLHPRFLVPLRTKGTVPGKRLQIYSMVRPSCSDDTCV
jgi:hypothetical protein